jgi:hypothetical protein
MSKSRFAAKPVTAGVSASLRGAAAVLMLGLIAGCASTPRDASASLAADRVAANQAKPAAGCVNDTGSRIQRKDDASRKDDCRNAGRTYSQRDLENTGEFNTGAALKRLDPSIQ